MSGLAFLPGDGLGGFGAAVVTPVANQVSGVALGDTDADRDLDAVATLFSNPGQVVPFTWNGTTFVAQTALVAGSAAVEPLLLDLDSDGDSDIVATSPFDNQIHSYLNVAGAFTAGTFQSDAVSGQPGHIAAGDIDEDGRRDIAAVREAGGVQVLRATGSAADRFTPLGGGLSAAQTGGALDIAFADLDGDGHLDIVVGGFSGVTVALGDGLGNFGLVRQYSGGGTDIRGVAVGDLDGDADPDVAAAEFTADHLAVFRNDGGGNLALEDTFPVTNPHNPVIADFNRDGALDVVAPQRVTPGSVTMFRNGAVVSASDLDFGPVLTGVGPGPVREVELLNDGGAPLNAGTASIGGAQAADFQIVDDGCSGQRLDPGEVCAIGIRFTPGAAGAREATVTVPGDAPAGATSVDLDGAGVPPTTGPPGPEGPAGPQGPAGPPAGTEPVDSTPPETTITKSPARTIHVAKATFKFTSSEAGSSFECSFNKRPFAPCSSPKTFKGLREGGHRLQVRAIDAAGNADPTPAVKRFRIVLD
jgi:hypothetical protein